jgi:hypothetical protein
MVARTADEDLNPPYSKNSVGFGQPFVPLQPDLGGWQGNLMDPYVVAQLEFIGGFNQEYLGSRVPVESDLCTSTGIVNCSANIELIPDHDACTQLQVDLGECGPVTDPAHIRPAVSDNFTRYQTLELEYTVGDTIWKLWLDGVEVSTQFTEASDTGGRDIDQEWGLPVPVGQPVPPMGEQQINGIIFGTTGDRSTWGNNKNRSVLFFDDICFTVNQSLDGACFAGGPMPLLGDANNDDQVTGADLISVQQNFGKTYSSDPSCDGLGLGDANDDCLVTGADLISVQQNFGKIAAAAVPEPATVALLMGSVLLLRRTKRR